MNSFKILIFDLKKHFEINKDCGIFIFLLSSKNPHMRKKRSINALEELIFHRINARFVK